MADRDAKKEVYCYEDPMLGMVYLDRNPADTKAPEEKREPDKRDPDEDNVYLNQEDPSRDWSNHGGYVRAYIDRDCKGRHVPLSKGRYDIGHLIPRIGNDRISSISVPKRWSVTLYVEAGFSGSSITLTAGRGGVGSECWNLDGGFNEAVSSLVVEENVSADPGVKNQVMPGFRGSATGYVRAEWQDTYEDGSSGRATNSPGQG
ncbi:hypothetical protein [Streptomyces sp. NPDC048489]|uniref:hypothetical protein n=1 Tax=Streptomyces sp. NPDC048489 TaxID=3154504 RepID=UPI003430CEE0